MTWPKVQDEVQPGEEVRKWEVIPRTGEPETNRSRLGHRVTKAEEIIDNLISKITSTKNSKHCIESELKDISMEYKGGYATAITDEEKSDNFEKAENDDIMAGLEDFRAGRHN